MFYGRDGILEDLSALFRKRTSSLVTCRGRRRIGKSTLIETFAARSDAAFIKMEGLRPAPKLDNDAELAHFASQLAAQTGCDASPPSDWLNAFLRLDREIADNRRTVVLLDEVSWMAHYDPTFAGTLKVAWDNRLKKHPRLILVVCGSVSTWIRDNIVESGSFYGRRSLDIVVPELPLSECVKFWGKAAFRIDFREILDFLSVVGGVPRYLEEVDPSATAAENIRRLCFRPKGVLREDFDEMFSDVVTRQPTFTASVLRRLAEGPRSAADIASEIGMVRGGRVSDALEQLVECGLASADEGNNPATGRPLREKRYRLRDNYARFYLKCIEPAKAVIDADAFAFGGLERLDGWEAIMGLAFENLVVNNFRELLGPLGLGSTQIVSAAPYRRAGGRKRGDEGVQVDLLLQSRRSVCLVEVKRMREIGRDVIDEMEEKVRLLPRRRGSSVKTALVYDGHLAPIVEADGYFDAIVPFHQLLGL
jgi:AAA+ ATPase superfamily predicted ATPase